MHFEKGATSNIENIFHDHDGLPYVPLLAVHLVMVLISVNSSSMYAGILIKVRQVIMLTFSMMIINQNPTIDRQLMVMFSSPKSANCKICPLLQSENIG